MTVKDLIDKLSIYDMSMKVTISDGYKGVFYDGEYSVEIFEDAIDIGIGGTNEEVEE
jgi:hypothetical protein